MSVDCVVLLSSTVRRAFSMLFADGLPVIRLAL